VRRGEEIDAATLHEYLRKRTECGDDFAITQFPNGHSNLTYLISTGGREYVLRRPPLGPVAPKAHDMVREYRVLRAVHPHYPEAPEAYVLCEDPEVLGAPFYVMERRRGVVLREEVPQGFEPEVVSEAFLDALVRLHSITGLSELGRPEGYVERQVRGWAERWQRAQTETEKGWEDFVIRWLGKNVPAPLAPTLIHNDYKLDNVLLNAECPSKVEAVLDWEMATVGDPLSDLGLTLCYWCWATAPEVQVAGIPALTAGPGWYTRNRMVGQYAERTGRDVSHIGYYEVLGVFKLAVIIQQIFYRFHVGQTSDERFRNFGERAKALGRLAAELATRYG